MIYVLVCHTAWEWGAGDGSCPYIRLHWDRPSGTFWAPNPLTFWDFNIRSLPDKLLKRMLLTVVVPSQEHILQAPGEQKSLILFPLSGGDCLYPHPYCRSCYFHAPIQVSQHPWGYLERHHLFLPNCRTLGQRLGHSNFLLHPGLALSRLALMRQWNSLYKCLV